MLSSVLRFGSALQWHAPLGNLSSEHGIVSCRKPPFGGVCQGQDEMVETQEQAAGVVVDKPVAVMFGSSLLNLSYEHEKVQKKKSRYIKQQTRPRAMQPKKARSISDLALFR